VLVSGFLVARLHEGREHEAAAFFLLFGIGLALMMVEDAGDIRHMLRSYVHAGFGSRVLGIQTGLIVEVPYFLALAAVPLYALVRYGRYVWRFPSSRRYMVAGYGLYAVAGGASGFRILGDLYVRVGRFIDERLFAGRFAVPQGQSQEYAHFYLVDGPIEESIESLAAACFVGLTLAVARELRVRFTTRAAREMSHYDGTPGPIR
jgi:hypothetical protein